MNGEAFLNPVHMGIVKAIPESMLCKGNMVLSYPILILILSKEYDGRNYIITFFSYPITGILYQA